MTVIPTWGRPCASTTRPGIHTGGQIFRASSSPSGRGCSGLRSNSAGISASGTSGTAGVLTTPLDEGRSNSCNPAVVSGAESTALPAEGTLRRPAPPISAISGMTAATTSDRKNVAPSRLFLFLIPLFSPFLKSVSFLLTVTRRSLWHSACGEQGTRVAELPFAYGRIRKKIIHFEIVEGRPYNIYTNRKLPQALSMLKHELPNNPTSGCRGVHDLSCLGVHRSSCG